MDMATKAKSKTIEERIEAFEKKVRERAVTEYPEEMIVGFVDFWTEYNEGARKFRAEQQKIFNIGKRLGRWFMNSKGKYNKLNQENETDKLRKEYGL